MISKLRRERKLLLEVGKKKNMKKKKHPQLLRREEGTGREKIGGHPGIEPGTSRKQVFRVNPKRESYH